MLSFQNDAKNNTKYIKSKKSNKGLFTMLTAAAVATGGYIKKDEILGIIKPSTAKNKNNDSAKSNKQNIDDNNQKLLRGYCD